MGRLIAMMEQITAKVEANTNAWWEGDKACWEAAEACLESKEPTSLDVESVAMHEEVPKEEAAMEHFGALKKHN
jgi:hypothetical protein